MKKENIVVVKKSCHSQEFLLGISHIRFRKRARLFKQKGDPRQNSSGMTTLFNNGAFTLIELLVVVLIIGILAAVAVPQYQKAVERSKGAEAMSVLKAVYNASKAYYLSNGTWPTSFSQLDVSIPWTGTTAWYYIGSYRSPISNKDWSMQILKSSQSNGISVARISGPYQGAYFHIAFTTYKNIPLEQIVCAENHRTWLSYYSFNKKRGDYCEKLFHGTRLTINSSDGNDYFALP